jgi:hypothetical protein
MKRELSIMLPFPQSMSKLCHLIIFELITDSRRREGGNKAVLGGNDDMQEWVARKCNDL